jgi:thioredoxin-related protein
MTVLQTGYAQVDTFRAPYLRFPNFPAVKLVFPDNNTYLAKEKLDNKKAVMLMVFNPQCEHCQHEIDQIVKHMNEFKNYQIVMATIMPFDSMIHFRERYQLAQYNNIIMGQDFQYYLPPFYQMRNLPYLAFYDKKKKLISVFEGSMPIEKALAELKKSAN